MACHIASTKSPQNCPAYNGLGQRVSQTVSSVVTEYLLDMQPGLWKVIAADDGMDVNRYIHDPVRGRILQHEGPSNDWNWPALDGLGTVRGVYDDTFTEVYTADRDPYGDLIAATGSNPTPFEYTGEPEDQNGLLHLRARYYDPNLAVFSSLDTLETQNRYAYVYGDPANLVDPSGLDGIKREPGGGGPIPGLGPLAVCAAKEGTGIGDCNTGRNSDTTVLSQALVHLGYAHLISGGQVYIHFPGSRERLTVSWEQFEEEAAAFADPNASSELVEFLARVANDDDDEDQMQPAHCVTMAWRCFYTPSARGFRRLYTRR